MSSDNYNNLYKEMGGLECKNIHFRPGAKVTSNFGLDSDRYKIINGKMVWGYPGLHLAIDRAGGTSYKGQKDGIFCPLNFEHSAFFDWKGKDWGSDVLLYHKSGFRLRICHMFPEEIAIMDRLTKGFPMYQDTYIGPAGTYGMSTGRHTHVEIEAWGSTWTKECDDLETILRVKYSEEEVNSVYTDEEIHDIYKSAEQTKDWKEKDMMKDYEKIIKSKNISFLNKYKARHIDNKNRESTLYNSMLLFNM
jgi:hypothetical protein